MEGNIVFYTVVNEHAEEIVLPDFPDHYLPETIFLEVLPHGYSKAAVLQDGCIETSCTPIVELYQAVHGNPLLDHVHVAIVEEEPQHFVIYEVDAIPEADSDSSGASDLSIMDSDSTDPEFPRDIVETEDSEEDPPSVSEEDDEEDDDEEDEDEEDDDDDAAPEYPLSPEYPARAVPAGLVQPWFARMRDDPIPEPVPEPSPEPVPEPIPEEEDDDDDDSSDSSDSSVYSFGPLPSPGSMHRASPAA